MFSGARAQSLLSVIDSCHLTDFILGQGMDLNSFSADLLHIFGLPRRPIPCGPLQCFRAR